MRKITLIILLSLLLSSSLFANDVITFSSGYSKASTQGDNKLLTLKENAVISVNSITIKADELIVEGEDYEKITASGNVVLTDSEKGLTISTSKLFFDRLTERLLISNFFEIQDTIEQMACTAFSLVYDIDSGKMDLSIQATVTKISDNDIMRAQAEKISYDSNSENLTLQTRAKLTYQGNNWEADIIKVNLDTNEVELEGKIKGVINE